MLTNIWKGITLYCISDQHDDAVPMKIMNGASPFYACPRYMLKDDVHPDGHAEGEKMCKNILSLKEAEDAIMAFIKIVDDDISNGIITDYTNFEFTAGQIKMCVLEQHGFETIKLGVVNKRTANS